MIRLGQARLGQQRWTRRSCRWLVLVSALLAADLIPWTSWGQQTPWVRPCTPADPLLWGRRDGIVFGLISKGGLKGPRGLIRIGVYAPGGTEPQLLNFIAVEPVVAGPGRRFDRMAFSELEMSELDPGEHGKRMWVHVEDAGAGANSPSSTSGRLETLHVGKATVERLSVRIDVERFSANGAHVYVIASIDSDHPSELRLTPQAEADSPPIEELTTTATMGNFERLRQLWLNGRVIKSKELFANFDGPAFAETTSYPLPELLRTDDGDAIVFCTSDEASPADSPGNAAAHWVYPLPKYTQYWRVPGYDVQPDLRVHVNARRVYWASIAPVLGGIAFENFELRERYVPGQTFIFGLTRSEPWNFYQGSSNLLAPKSTAGSPPATPNQGTSTP